MQFHPEISQIFGFKLMRRVLENIQMLKKIIIQLQLEITLLSNHSIYHYLPIGRPKVVVENLDRWELMRFLFKLLIEVKII